MLISRTSDVGETFESSLLVSLIKKAKRRHGRSLAAY